MAREDLLAAEGLLNSGKYANSVFYAELSSQKAVKALIVSLGYEPGKTHKPTAVLKALLASGLIEINDSSVNVFNQLMSLAIVLEDQGVTPRYGWETLDRIIKPSEIYDESKAAALLGNAKRVLELTEKLIGDLDC